MEKVVSDLRKRAGRKGRGEVTCIRNKLVNNAADFSNYDNWMLSGRRARRVIGGNVAECDNFVKFAFFTKEGEGRKFTERNRWLKMPRDV